MDKVFGGPNTKVFEQKVVGDWSDPIKMLKKKF